ncbi:MAG TPA: hypothetical protein VEZ52_07520 [Desulfovibrio sp.]|uniref:hypothetical protein n=1 Tax=Desulfovibrio sp. TaxID=885 RepID=UPI002D422111|nr:hypothetical protein [Desulfovibrio sp.]HZF61456.1 hypothetical protein [Desulfovibrio sp.]
MDSITSANYNSVQPSNVSATATTNEKNVSKKNDSSELQQGDTVTISEEGKKLSKSVDKSDENEPSTNSDSGLTVSNMKISQQLQDAKNKQKQLTAKIVEEKAQGNDVSALNAQLSDAQQNVKKFQNKTNQ